MIKVDVVSASAKVRAHTVGNDKTNSDGEERKSGRGLSQHILNTYGEPIPGKVLSRKRITKGVVFLGGCSASQTVTTAVL